MIMRLELKPFDIWNLLDKLIILRFFSLFVHNFFVYFTWSCWFLSIMIITQKNVNFTQIKFRVNVVVIFLLFLPFVVVSLSTQKDIKRWQDMFSPAPTPRGSSPFQLRYDMLVLFVTCICGFVGTLTTIDNLGHSMKNIIR